VTPILGGSSQTRALDDVEVIRPATVRGHLRFWWRALHGHEFASSEDLLLAEATLWGRAATDEAGRSTVELRIDVETLGEIDFEPIRLYDSRAGRATPGAYALWPAKEQAEDPKRDRAYVPTAARRRPGTLFRLRLIGPKDREVQLRNVIRAWLLFGGYGSRTRRGLGSFTVTEDAAAWLPQNATRDSFAVLFGRDLFAATRRTALDTPWLAGAALQVGKADEDAMRAWTRALDWLREFRQGASGGSGDRAREPGTGKLEPNRPSISNWPEADKVRHLEGKMAAHPPRHNATPAWPRASFGLPIVGQFQKKARNGGRLDEPGWFELRWRSGAGEHDRLASPLIVKALPLAGGTFVPCAVWLNRGLPAGAEAGLARQRPGAPREKEVNPRSAAPFSRLVAPADTPCFSALAGKTSLRDAFLDWLVARHRTMVVAP
jgi:CRISPR-associated protein Cmr1